MSVTQKVVKREPEIQQVMRGIPAWLQELENASSSLNRRKKAEELKTV